MTHYLHKDVFLETQTAKYLYHEVAKNLPIIDFHTHLPQAEILEDRRFNDIWELWLEHDHYKWRLMRACGVDETYITGNATPKEKFIAFASVMPMAIGNPVHHWAHLELQRVFQIDLILNSKNAEQIWVETQQQLTERTDLSVQGLLKQFNVELVCTTDDPADDLISHQKINQSSIATKVFSTFRPDQADISQGSAPLKKWLTRLEQSASTVIKNYQDLLNTLKERHDFFHQQGCRLSDHGLTQMPFALLPQDELEQGFQACLNEKEITFDLAQAFKYDILKHVAQWNSEKSWTMQLHIGPQRNVNSQMAKQTGRDSGFDTMSSSEQTTNLISALDDFEKNNILGKTIVYNLNPNESESICCALQSFQNSTAKGLIQYGPAWWHLDHIRGIREQMDILTSLGAIGTSIGMLTDSRSFTSYVRHEYYRRLLCQYIGNAAEAGEMPNDKESLSQTITDICYTNAATYFGWS